MSKIVQKTLAMMTGGQITPEEFHFICTIGSRASAEIHENGDNIKAVVDDMMIIQRELIMMHNTMVQDIVDQSMEEALKTMPLILPENKMLLQEIPRGFRVVIVGAPANSAQQLQDNMPGKPVIYTVSTSTKPAFKASMKDVVKKGPDLLIVSNLTKVFNQCVDRTADPVRVRVNEVCRKISRSIQSHATAAVMFTDTLDPGYKDALEENGVRVVIWNEEDFGPDAFFGKEDAEKRLQTSMDIIEEARAQAMAAIAEAEKMDAEEVAAEASETDAEEPAEESSIVTP